MIGLRCWLTMVAGLALVPGSLVGSEPPEAKVEQTPIRERPTDRYGDPLPPGAVARIGTLRLRHQGAVFSVAFAADGKTLASAGADNFVRVWDTATGKAIHFLPVANGHRMALAFSPDGKLLAAQQHDGVIFFWDAVTGKEVDRLQAMDYGYGEGYKPRLAFSPDSKLLITSLDGRITLWDSRTGREQKQLLKDKYEERCAAFTPDAGMLLIRNPSGSAELIDEATGRKVRAISADTRVAAFSKDGKRLATADLRVWDVDSGKEIQQLPGSSISTSCLAFSPDGKKLAAGASQNDHLHLYDIGTGKCRWLSEGLNQRDIHAVDFSPDGKLLASAGDDGRVRLWDVTTGKEVERGGRETGYMHMSLAPDGKTLAVFGGDDLIRNDTIHLWDTASGKPRGKRWDAETYLSAVAYSPKGGLLAATAQVGFRYTTILLWDTETGRLLHHLGRQEGATKFITFSPNGTQLATVDRWSSPGQVHVWDLATGKEVQTLSGSDKGFERVAFSPSGKVLATTSEDGTLRLWDLAAGKEIRRWVGHGNNWIGSVAFSPDGKTLASVGGDGFLALWDPMTGQLLRHMSKEIAWGSCLAFAPDGKLVASGDSEHTFSIWETATGKRCYRIEGHQNTITSLAFTSDGKTLVSASNDGTALVWDMSKLTNPPTTEKEKPGLKDLDGNPLPAGAIARLGSVHLRHEAGVAALAVAPDGKTLAASAGNEDTSLRLWDVASRKELRRFRQHYRYGMEHVAFSGDGRILAGSTFDGAYVWDTGSGELLWHFSGRPDYEHDLSAIALAPDGKLLAAGFRDNQQKVRDNPIVLWDLSTGKEAKRLLGPQTAVQGLVFSTDGKRLLCASEQEIFAWDVATRKLWRRIPIPIQHQAIALSPDGKRLAFPRERTTCVWDLEQNQALYTVDGAGGGIAFSADGKTLGTVSAGENIRLWEVATGKEACRLQGYPGQGCFRLCFSADGRMLAAAYGSGIRLWDVATGQERRPSIGHQDAVSCLAYTPDGKRLVSASSDQTIRIWQANTGRELRCSVRHQDRITGLTLSSDGKTVASGDASNTIHLWEAATGKELRKWKVQPLQADQYLRGINSLVFFPDGKTLVSGSEDGTICFWEPATGKELRKFKGGASVALAPDGKLLAFADSQDTGVYESIGSIHLWSVDRLKELRKIEGKKNEAFRVGVFSPDGKILAAASYFIDHFHGHTHDAGLHFYEVATGKQILMLETSTFPIAFSPDGKTLITGGGDRGPSSGIHIVDLAAGREVGQLTGHLGSITALAFSPEATTFASGSADNTVLVWDADWPKLRRRGLPADLTPQELQALWADLHADDADRAFRAVWSLVAVPQRTVPFLQEQLQPVRLLEAQRLAQMVKDLDSDHFTVRKRAMLDLEKQERSAELALRKALEKQPSLETRRRIELLLNKLEGKAPSSALVRALRATTVLERIASPQARQLLEALARGAPEAWLTQEANASLRRLGKAAGASEQR